MNPMDLLHFRPMLEQFHARHPKFVQFFGYAGKNLTQDSIVEISITSPEGKKTVTNIRVTAEDIELFQQLRGLMRP